MSFWGVLTTSHGLLQDMKLAQGSPYNNTIYSCEIVTTALIEGGCLIYVLSHVTFLLSLWTNLLVNDQKGSQRY